MEGERITAYIDHLRGECGLLISLHLLRRTGLSLAEQLLPYNLHENAYCLYVKLQPKMWRACIGRQSKVLEACRGGAICGTCHAGVRELVYPITAHEETVGFISVSGFADENGASYRARIAEKYGFPRSELDALYARLSTVPPDRKRSDTLIYPLCAMLTLALEGEEDGGQEQQFSLRLMHYLRLNHTRRLTMAEICAEFHCSPSYISHRFKEQTGMTVHRYLTRLRIENAARLLSVGHLNVTEIALATGFDNSNYFSHVFRAEMGLSPKEYRAAAREEKTYESRI